MTYTYGPVPSRRLGISLGIDLVPRKVCTYDCIYCQLGRTAPQTVERREYVTSPPILQDLKQALAELGGDVDYIAMSGSGEPTLNSKIGEVIQGVKELTSIPVAVITNGSLLWRKEVREDLLLADVVMPSLDAVTPDVFHTINRPHASLEISQIIQGLVDFRSVYSGQMWLEIFLCRAVNDDRVEIERFREVIPTIQPDKIQLNTVVRPSVEDYAAPLTLSNMERVRSALGSGAEIIADSPPLGRKIPSGNLEEKVMHLLERRPVTPDDLTHTLGLHDLEVTKILDRLTKEGRIKYRVFNHRLYYEVTKRGA